MRSVGGAMLTVKGAVGGLAAAAFAGAAAWFAYDASTRAVQNAANGLGRAIGVSPVALEAVAQAAAKAGDVSVRAARAMQVAYLNTGRIGTEVMGAAIALNTRFAATLGIEATQATEQLAKALADPLRGFDELNRTLGFLDDRTRTYIRALVDSGNRAEAQRIALDKLKPALVAQADATSAIARAWNRVWREASNAADAVGGAIDRMAGVQSVEERLRDAIASRDSRSTSRRQASFYQRDIDNLSIENTERLLRRQARAESAEAARASVMAGDAARDVLPGVRVLERLRAVQAQLRAALDNPQARAALADVGQVEDAYRRVTDQIARYTGAVDGASGSTARLSGEQAAAVRATLDLAEAHGQGAAAVLKAEAAREGAMARLRDGIDPGVAASEALARSIADRALAGAELAADLEAQARAQARLNAAIAAGTMTAQQAERAMQQERALRPLLAAQALAEGDAKETLTRIIERLKAAYGAMGEAQASADRAQAQTAARDLLRDQADEIATLRTSIGLMGRAQTERAAILAQLRMEQQLRQRGIDLMGTEARLLVAQSGLVARLQQEEQRRLSAIEGLQGAFESAFDQFGDVIAEGTLDWDSWRDASKAAILDINRELVRLAILNPLKNLLFGTSYGTLGDIQGGLFGSLFSGLSGARAPVAATGAVTSSALTAPSAATVSAATVSTATLATATSGAVAAIPAVAAALARQGIASPLAPVIMANGGAIRSLPLDPGLSTRIGESILSVYGPGYAARVFSGGQPVLGSGLPRVGTTRHDLGMAADLRVVSPSGAILTGDQLAPLAQYWRARDYGGVGLEMGQGGIHLDLHRDRATSWSYGTMTDAQRLAIERGNAGILPGTTSSVTDLMRSSTGASDALERMRQTTSDAGESLWNFASGTTSASTDLVRSTTASGTSIASAGTTLQTSATTFATDSQGMFTSLLGGLGAGIDGLFKGLSGLFSGIGSGLTSGFGSLFSGLFGGFGTPVRAGVSHAGGLAGYASLSRTVPAALFGGAQMNRAAFLAPDEVPTILQRGERIQNRGEVAASRALRGHEPAAAPVTIIIQTPNPQAFRSSQTQIAAQLARAVRSGSRGN